MKPARQTFLLPFVILGMTIAAQTSPAATIVLTHNQSGDVLSQFGITKLQYDNVGTDSRNKQVTIAKVNARSIAAAEGLNKGDIITAINDHGWQSREQLTQVLAEAAQTGFFRLKRNNKPSVLLVDTRITEKQLEELGLKVADDKSNDGVLIDSATKTASSIGLRDGDHIVFVDGTMRDNKDVFAHFVYKGIQQHSSVKLSILPNGKSVAGLFTKVFPPPAPPAPVTTRGIQSTQTGPPVEFPVYLGPGSEAKPPLKADQSENLSNEVMSARVELYYFRDAHRVAQILNRTARSYNSAAVTQSQRVAQDARDKAEEATAKRQSAEIEARQKATALREKERQLAHEVGELRQMLGKQKRLDEWTTQISKLKDELKAQNIIPAERDRLNAELDRKTRDKELLEKEIGSDRATADVVRQSIENLVSEIDEGRKEILRLQLDVEKLKNAEKRAAENQFRTEVSAAKVDPDTYAPANRDSIDPVAQVSISVIGEGVLHLRGPRRGVMELREMIDQIDHPVGQVKIGVLTVQLNGEHNDRMANTVRRVEGNISRARFLAYVSRQLFQRAIVEVATDMASGVGPSVVAVVDEQPGFSEYAEQRGSQTQQDRWQRYLQNFFGADFLKALSEVDADTSLLNPLNQLLSLSSADTVTLAEALFATGLAKGTVRDEILMRFDCYLQDELPRMESQWMLTNGIHHRFDPRWWGDAKKGRAHVEEQARRKYKFQAIQAYFRRCFDSPDLAADRLNPLQREVVKLVQGIALEQSLRAQRDTLVLKSSLLDGHEKALTDVERRFLKAQIESLREQHLAAEESLRGRKAAIDTLIKHAMIAIEDDVEAQFYNPALERIRKAASEWDVELGVVERTTILTNNRAFAKVEPEATYEFDLPKRDILIAEALKAAYALHQDIGPLLADPEFGTLASMFVGQSITGSALSGTIKNVLPGLPTDTDQKDLLFADSADRPRFGTELEKMIPNPAIYKFETGTGFEVRPVIQPDGQSVVFDFNYMYSTDLLESARPDEKHLGRVKRHYINTQVQLGTLEWREISRYDVALKAARTARGVPLLEDIPIAGLLFRPLPQAQKSLQKNIIIGQAVIYPTIQDLLGLRPAAMHPLDLVGIVQQARCEVNQNQARLQQLNQRLDQVLQSAWHAAPSQACPDSPNASLFPPKPDPPGYGRVRATPDDQPSQPSSKQP